ncbi:hypothetical protein ScalyP_jg434 [Parmales sp. scaly parma]|nr:hypothetical protein ScalyP_jg434 [Parmales sp. scaly parma]|tara:strand:+ start:112 stop:564 length:453 start_codon:yes stop_codon:yes gene_type:complete
MPHGDFSDYAAWSCAGLGVTALFAPSLYFKTFGPVAAFFEGPITPELTCALRFLGGLLLYHWFTLFVVRWNTLNGKAGGLGLICTSAACAFNAWSMDKSFKLRGWWIVSVWFFAGAMHLMFNANPMWTSETLKAKEIERAEKKNNKNKSN